MSFFIADSLGHAEETRVQFLTFQQTFSVNLNESLII